jgi:hypothetical protein
MELYSGYLLCHTGRSAATIRYLTNKHSLETPDQVRGDRFGIRAGADVHQAVS